MARRNSAIFLWFALYLAVTPLRADEIYSNASGGGDWSEPATWRGGKVPAADDEVVIARDDVVMFDRNDDGRTTCRQLLLDPRAVLQFKAGIGPVTLSLNGPLESYGYVRLDASKSAKDLYELRFAAEDPEQRLLKLEKGGGLVALGKLGLAKGKKNVLFASRPPKTEVPAGTPPPDPTAKLMALPGSTLDLQRAELDNISVLPEGIDNTGAKPGERINIIKNHFIGTSRLSVQACDSPVVNENLFERDDPVLVQPAAMYFSGNPLLEARGNVVRGSYAQGMHCYSQGECTVADNLLEKCPYGLYWLGHGFMIKRLTIKDCGGGMLLNVSSGTLEDVTITGTPNAYHHGNSAIQTTNFVIKDSPPGDNYKIYYQNGPLTLINSTIKPEDIRFAADVAPVPAIAGKPRLPMITSLSFLVVQVTGQLPVGIAVDVKTAGLTLPPGAQDPNVRNCPAAVLKTGLTPLPKSLEPILVRSWQYDADRNLQPAPTYQFQIVGPDQGEATPRKVLKSLAVTPAAAWYRENANDKKPTLEISLP